MEVHAGFPSAVALGGRYLTGLGRTVRHVPPLVFTIVRLPYPVVIINWVQYLGPPGPFSFPDSQDLIEMLRELP